MMDFDFNAVLENFRIECEEGVQNLERSLLELERTPDDQEQIQTVFRIVHTIKGNAFALEMPELGRFSHEIENILGGLREGTVKMTSTLCSALLKVVDALRAATAAAVAGKQVLPEKCAESLREVTALMGTQVRLPGDADAAQHTSQVAHNGSAEYSNTLRVKVEKLDSMMDMAGEIAILQSRLERSLEDLGDSGREALERHQELRRLFLALQEHLLKARMVSIQPLFQRFHRVVRDLASASGKRAALIVESGDVEVDTAVAEQLKDALMHMVRNAIDHGLEKPEIRQQNGKNPCGTITLRARHESGSILIQVSDDGAGFHREKILARARKKGLISQQKLSDAEIFTLVFTPGFSTADEVTGLSGRGVGMDVVRRNIDALHGAIHIESREGQGSTIHLRLPLTLSIVEGITVSAGGENYVVPLESVVECMQLPKPGKDEAGSGIFSVRGEPLPYLRLRDVFGLKEAKPAARENVLIVNYGAGKAGIAVDELLGKGQAVIKPLGRLFRKVRGLAGSTILGDGCVALILDVPALVREAMAHQRVILDEMTHCNSV